MKEIHSGPVISVIMGIYNCADTLPRAIESVLNQTYQDFELIMCDDGSQDHTYAVAGKYARENPEHIILLKNDSNRGLNYTLNKCLSVARGRYIARMDGDDASLPNRFAVEVEFLENHPEYALVSACLDIFDEEGIWGKAKFLEEPKPEDLVRGRSFSHSAVMIRKDVMDEVGGYSEGKRLMRVEDKHLWYKIFAKGYRGYNLQEVLYLYCDDRNGFTKRKLKHRFNSCYVSHLMIRTFRLPARYYLFAVRPILTGLLPYWLYRILHREKMGI